MSALLRFIDIVDGFNLRVGRFVMYGVFVLMAILLWSSISKTFFTPSLWTLEMAQFAMVCLLHAWWPLFHSHGLKRENGSFSMVTSHYAAKLPLIPLPSSS